MTFSPLGSDSSKVTLRVEYEPDGLKETAGSLLGLAGGQVRQDLERFKEFIERRGEETGSWRGKIAV